MEQTELQRAIEAILFAAGERIETARLSAVLEVDAADVIAAADALVNEFAFARRGIRILKLEDGYQMVSSSETVLFLHISRMEIKVATTSERLLFPLNRFFNFSKPRSSKCRRTSPVLRDTG